jgi:co-chaperonin GroES (HSP10)
VKSNYFFLYFFPESMELTPAKQIIVVGDRVLILPDSDKDRTAHGLYLPPSVREKDKVQSGYIVKVGPGYPVPNPQFMDQEPWSTAPKEPVKYIPLQAEQGDYALFLRDQSIEIEFEQKKYLIVSQSAILVLVRQDIIKTLEG